MIRGKKRIWRGDNFFCFFPSKIKAFVFCLKLPSPGERRSSGAERGALLERCAFLERECSLLREENSALSRSLASSDERAELLGAQKEELWRELNEERRRMEGLREEMRSFGLALAQRDGLLQALYTRSKAFAGSLSARPVVMP